MGELLTGINIAKENVSNMTIETIYVAPDAVSYILNNINLDTKEQEQLTDELVDRTKDWLELEDDVQIEKIEIAFIQGTVVKYLISSKTIRAECSGYSVGIREDDGAVVVEATYVHLNREERRMWEKRSKAQGKKKKVIQFERRKKDE